MLWFHLPGVAAVSYASKRPENDVGSYSGPAFFQAFPADAVAGTKHTVL